MNDTTELAMHLWAGYQHDFEDAMDSIDNVSNVARFVPSLAKASEALGQRLHANEVDYAGVFLYDVAQSAGAWLAGASKNTTVEEFEAHVNTLVAKGIVK